MKTKKGSSGLRVFGATLLQGLLTGAAIGCLTGLLEVTALLPKTGGTAINFLIPAMGFYGTVWAVLAVGFGVTLFVIARLFNKPVTAGEPLTRWYLAVLIPLSLFIVGGGHINMWFLPASTDWRSLLFDAIYLLMNVWLGSWLYHHGVSRTWRFLRRCSPRLWLALVAGALVGGVLTGSLSIWNRHRIAQSAHRSAVGSGPNVLLIAIDALRPDHLSGYGYHRRTSPNLDQLAQEGVLFTNAFANSSWTKASVATILTSLYPSAHGANQMAAGVPPALLTLPEALQTHGYATGVFSANSFVSPLFGFAQGVDRFHYKEVSVFKQFILGQILRKFRKHSSLINRLYVGLEEPEALSRSGRQKATTAPGLRDTFLNWIDRLNGKPFFAYFHYMETHTPYTAPSPFNALFRTGSQAPYQVPAPISIGFHPFLKSEPIPSPQFDTLMAHYDAAIAYVDHVLGELFRALRDRGLYERTIVIVTADHGEEFYDHGSWGHGKSLFNELIHVPLIVRYPPVFPRGNVSIQTARHVDLMPTILDLCDISVSSFMEGRSLVSIVRGNPEAVSDSPPIYSEVFYAGSSARAVRVGRFKLIEARLHSQEAWLLFDLEQDPSEQRPLDVNTHPMGQELKQLLASFRERTHRMAVAPKAVHIDQETQDELRALGYLQ